MSDLKHLIELLACPRCDKKPLNLSDEHFSCSSCNTVFPNLGVIPWLFAEPDTALSDWRGRFDHAITQYYYESDGLTAELEAKDLDAATQERLSWHRDALQDQAARLSDFMGPLAVHGLEANHFTYLALRTRLPSDQGLNTYYTNIHRDWVWGATENQASMDLISQMTPAKTGKTVVLGAGAGRLAYDFHQSQSPEITVVLDFNPLLLLLGSHMSQGNKLELYEFPLAPKTAEDVAVLQTLEAPAVSADNLYFLGGDVLRAPLGPNSFDTIITPWLIDVISEPLGTFAKRINRWLAPGGTWISFGSLAFAHAQKKDNLSLNETADLISASGFSKPKVSQSDIPYMCSPHSRHGRQENVVTLAAEKIKEVKAPKRYVSLPEWLVKGDEPVPVSRSFQAQSMSTRIYAFIMAMIDGKRSIKDMAKLMAEQRLMTVAEAEPAIRNFMIKMYEESQRG